jgi:hypothetical protein
MAKSLDFKMLKQRAGNVQPKIFRGLMCFALQKIEGFCLLGGGWGWGDGGGVGVAQKTGNGSWICIALC